MRVPHADVRLAGREGRRCRSRSSPGGRSRSTPPPTASRSPTRSSTRCSRCPTARRSRRRAGAAGWRTRPSTTSSPVSRSPRWRSDLWTPSRVPPDSHWLAQLFTQRLRDSFFTGSAAKFVTWSMHSDDETWVFKGVTRWTKEEELPRLIASIDAGRPVVLGLVVARNLAAIGDNHQVIAYGYEQDRTTGRTTVLDPRQQHAPQGGDAHVRGGPARLDRVQRPLVARLLPAGLHAHDARGCSPRRRPACKDPVSTGDTVKLSHVWTGLTLHSHDLPYTHPGSDGLQQVTCFGGCRRQRPLAAGRDRRDPGRHRPARRVGRPAAARLDRAVAAQQRGRAVAALPPAAGQRLGHRRRRRGLAGRGRRRAAVDRRRPRPPRARRDGHRPALPPRLRPSADRRPAGGHRPTASATSTTGGRSSS